MSASAPPSSSSSLWFCIVTATKKVVCRGGSACVYHHHDHHHITIMHLGIRLKQIFTLSADRRAHSRFLLSLHLSSTYNTYQDHLKFKKSLSVFICQLLLLEQNITLMSELTCWVQYIVCVWWDVEQKKENIVRSPYLVRVHVTHVTVL